MTSVLVTGASGLIGARVVSLLVEAGHDVTGTFHGQEGRLPGGEALRRVRLELEDESSIGAAFRAAWPEAVIHCAAMSDLKSCEVEPERAKKVNVLGTAKLARLCQTIGARMIFCSTDQVYDGAAGAYDETSEAKPLHTYGQTKLAAEKEVARGVANSTSARIALVFGASPAGDRSASEKVDQALRAGEPPKLFVDERRSPVLVDDVARVLVDLIDERDLPVVNLGGPDAVSRHEFGVRYARAHGLDEARIVATKLAELDLMPPRPPDLSLDTKLLRARLPRPPRGLDEAFAALSRTAEAAR